MATRPQSAIREVRDQLFLDRADGKYLTTVASNLGIDRPLLSFNDDDLWRAVVRRIALDYKQIINLFIDLLTQIFGPQKTVVTVLAQNVVAADLELIVRDQLRIPQLGTLVIDEALPTEEAIEYSFNDPRNGLVCLDTIATQAHSSTMDVQIGSPPTTVTIQKENVENFLRSSVSIAATLLPIEDSHLFPIGTFPYTILIDAGTINEEVVQLTGNTIATNTLAVSALAKAHGGPTITFISSPLVSVSPDSIVVRVTDVANFPSEGLIRITGNGGAPTEDVRYVSKDSVSDTIQLSKKLVNSYITATVNLLKPGTKVQLAQVQVKGIGWEVFETENRVLRIFLPLSLTVNRLLDAAFLHDRIISAAPSTTVGIGGSLVGATKLLLTNASAFPLAGVILINFGGGTQETIGYSRIDRFSTVIHASDTVVPISGVPAGSGLASSPLFVADVTPLLAAQNITKTLFLGRGTANFETKVWSSIDTAKNSIVLTTITANPHAANELVEVSDPNVLFLNRGLTFAHAAAETVSLVENEYVGLDLEDGDQSYQGPYLYAPGERIAEATETLLTENVAGPTELVVDQKATRTSIEVKNATFFINGNDVRIGRNLAGDETKLITDVTLRTSVTGVTIAVLASAGATSITVSAASGLPEARGYRLFIDDNVSSGTKEEVVIVKSFNPGTNVVEIESGDALVNTHSVGDVVQLMADVLTIDPLISDHIGIIPFSQRKRLSPLFGEDWQSATPGNPTVIGPINTNRSLIEEIRTSINVASSVGFPSVGDFSILNFASRFRPVESRLIANVSVGGTTLSLESTDAFPTSGFPYFVTIGVDNTIVEYRQVSANSTGLDQLTISTGVSFVHNKGEWVRFETGPQDTIEFTGVAAGLLLFSPGIRFQNQHLKNEPVSLSGIEAIPSRIGFDFPFKLPSSWRDRLEFLFDLARAAGVEVIVIFDK